MPEHEPNPSLIKNDVITDQRNVEHQAVGRAFVSGFRDALPDTLRAFFDTYIDTESGNPTMGRSETAKHLQISVDTVDKRIHTIGVMFRKYSQPNPIR